MVPDAVSELTERISKPAIIGLVAVLFVGGLILSYGGGDAPSSTDGDNETVLQMVFPDYGPNPVMWPLRNDRVHADGIRIDPVSVTPGEAGRITLAEPNEYELGTMDIAGIASLVRQGNFQDHVAIGGYYIEGLIPGGGTGVQLYTQDGSDVESPSDLAGRTLALGERGSTSNLLVKTVLDERHNLSPSDYEIVYKPDSSDILLEQGDVDAALVWTRHIVDPEWRAQYTKVLDAGQEYADMYGAVPSNNVIVADREAVMQNPERYRKAVELVWRSHYWAEQNRDVVAQDFKSQNPDFNISAWKEELQYNDYQHNMTAERIRANNKLFEVQSKYSGVNGTVQMDDFYVNVTELAAER